jgi:hypothetical protein
MLRLFQVEFVPKIVGNTSYPDPLPPLKPLDLQADQVQPVWISVTVPKDAKMYHLESSFLVRRSLARSRK